MKMLTFKCLIIIARRVKYTYIMYLMLQKEHRDMRDHHKHHKKFTLHLHFYCMNYQGFRSPTGPAVQFNTFCPGFK